MAIRFCFDDGGEMPVKEGLPARYDGTIIKGAQPSYIELPFATIVNQEYNNVYFSVSESAVTWKQKKLIICDYDYPHGMFTRTALDKSLHEFVKGAGAVHLIKDQFSLIAGSSWKSFLYPARPAKHTFLNISWSADFISDYLKEDITLETALNNSTGGLPIRIIDPPSFRNGTMKQLHYEMTQLNLAGTKNVAVLDGLLKKYCSLLMNERKRFDAYTRGMSKEDWAGIQSAIRLIEDKLDISYTTKQISDAIDMNDNKLKKLFQKVTGFSLEEYRKYKLCVRTALKIIRMPDVPIKSFYSESGYSTMPNYTRACLKHCCCKPSQIRKKEWDVKGLSQDLIVVP